MGASEFYNFGFGKTAKEAFGLVVEQAQYDHGHSGYSGTIAEKHTFTMIPLLENKDPEDYAEQLIRDSDDRVDDKWGPAGCIEVPLTDKDKKDHPGLKKFLFFGWASS
jgi:hypothetical protein